MTSAPVEPAESASPVAAARRRRAGMLAIWVAGTVTAMVVATLAVQVAGAKVTQRPAATVSRSQIETEVARQRAATTQPAESGAGSVGPGAAGPAAGTEAPAGASDEVASSAPGAPPSTAPGSPSSPGAPSPAPQPSPTTAAAGPGRSSTTVVAPPTPRTPATSTSPAAPAPTVPPPSTAPATTAPVSEQTYVLTGGSVRVRCTGATVQRLSSSPAPGFAMEIRSSGPQEVDVRFDAAEHRSELKATCSTTGAIVSEPREENHGGSGAGSATSGP